LLALNFANQHNAVWASVGLHPHEAKNLAAEKDKLKNLAKKPKVVAIGECGLDYYYQHSPKSDQINAMRYQIELALELNLPLIFISVTLMMIFGRI